MNQKELSRWAQLVYEDGFNDGYNACLEHSQDMDWELVKIAIRATKGVGKKKSEEIIKTVENICFEGNKNGGFSECEE